MRNCFCVIGGWLGRSSATGTTSAMYADMSCDFLVLQSNRVKTIKHYL